MIPFTPDERRLQFAPSQNVGGAVARDVRDIIGAQTQPTMAAQVDYGVPSIPTVQSDVADILSESQVPLMSSLMGASRVNPDQAAEAKRLGSQIGVGQDIALRNLEEVRQRAFMAEMQRRDIARSNPILANFLSDRAFANEASDDIGTLAKIGEFFSDIPSELQRGYRRGQLVAERGDIGAAVIIGEALLDETSDQEARFYAARKIADELRDLQGGGVLAATAEVVAQNLSQAREMIGGTVLGAAAGTLIAPGPGTALGGAVGFSGATVLTTAKMEAGNMYLDLREQGIEDQSAIPIALAAGLLNGVIEAVGMEIAAVPFRNLAKKIMSEQIAKAVIRPTMRKALAEAGMAYLGQVASEATEEGLQEIVNVTSEEIAKAVQGIDSETSLRGASARVLDSFVQGAMGSAILGGIGPGANLYVDLRRAGRAQKQTQFFDGLSQNATESKLKARDPGAYERFVAATAAGTNAETVYIDGATMRDVLTQAGVTDAQLDAIIPGLAQQVRQAAELGNDVTLPTAQFVSRLAGTPLGDALLPHMRLSPDAMSAMEAQQFEENREALVEEARALLDAKTESESAFVQEADQVFSTMRERLVAAGRDPALADIEALMHQAFVVTQAANRGMTPLQFEAESGLRGVVGVPQVGAPMEQAAQFTPSGERRTDTPEFKAWSRNATLIDGNATEFSTGQPFVGKAYHGSPVGDIQAFDPLAPSRFRKELERGMGAVWFGAEPAIATNFAGMTGSVYPVYVTMQNPLVVDAATEAQPDLYVRLPGGQTIYDIQYIKAAAIARAKRDGHDGVVFVNAYDGAPVAGKATIYAAFNPEDIKSVNNRGTWSRTSPNIMAQPAMPAPDAGVFNANNPPAPLANGQPIVAVLTSDGEVLYDRDATMHGDLAEKFPDKADLIIDGGFIVDGQYQMGQSQGGYSAFEGEPEQVKLAKKLAAKANKRQPQMLGQQRAKHPYRSLLKAWDKYNDPDAEIQTPEDLADIVESLLDDARAPAELDEAIRKFREEQAYDIEVKGRGEMDTAGEQLETAVQNAAEAIRQEMASPQMLEQAATVDADYMAAVKRGDMEAAQRMVDEAANREMRNSQVRDDAKKLLKRYHGGIAGISSFTGVLRRESAYGVAGKPSLHNQGIWLAGVPGKLGVEGQTMYEAAAYANNYLPNAEVYSLYANITNPKRIGLADAQNWTVEELQAQGYDGAYLVDTGAWVAFAPEQVKRSDPVTYDEAGNVIPLSRRFDITSPRIFEQAAMSTRVPSAKGMEMAALDSMLLADWDAMKDNEKLIAGNLAKIKELEFPVKLDETKTPREQLEQFMEAVADNLDYLYEQMDSTQRERAKMWYVGGRRIVDWLAGRYGITDMQAAAMLAVLSPQKNWFENVSMADRIGDILTSARNERWSPEMEKNFRRMVEDVRARVTITERQIEENEKPKKPTKPRTEESLEDFKARKEAFDARRPRLKAKYERDLAQWEQELEEYETELAELQESGESTTIIRADMAAHRRERPKSPRMPGRVVAESAAEFAARKEQYKTDLAEWEKRDTRLAKILKSKQDKIKYLDDLSASPRMKAMREGTLQTVLASKDLELAGMFVRMFDEEHNDRTFAIITPEGGMAGPSMGASGPMSMRWGSYSTIQKAISVYEDGRAENVHHQIGKAHKVRNFYNNLFDPTNVNAATIDTHAIAASALMPLSASDDIVGWGLGAGASDARLGLHGGYPILFEAYRRAAARRSIIAREEQSITWEAIRGLFRAAEKKTLKPIIAEVWGRYMKGDISLDDARAEVFKLAGGIKTPEWVAQPTDIPVGSTYSGRSRSLMDGMAPAIQQQMQQMTRMSFEIAPDLRNKKLSDAWKALPMATRHDISRSVMAKIVPQILKEFGVTAAIEEQIGGWEGGTELSFAMSLPSTTLVRQISQTLREVLSQKAIFSISAEKFEGASRAGLVVIDLQPGATPDQITELYEKRLYPIIKLGHSTVGSSMIIGLEEGVDSGKLADMIEAKIGDDPLIVNIDDGEAWSLNDQSPEPTVQKAAVDEGTPARVNERRRLDALQTEATRLIADELRAAGLYEQAAVRSPARGGYDPARLKILLGPDADFTTGAHELAHFYVDYYTKQALAGTATPQMRADLDIMFQFVGVAGDTPETRLAAFSAMPFETARPLVEAITYNAEVYLFEGKAPSVELAGVFDRMLQFFRRAYKSIVDFVTQQQEIYRREFGRELPGLNDELRAVFDRMLADERQIKQAQAVSQMRGQFTVKPDGMDDAEWAAYQEMAGEATNEAIRDMTKASLRQMEWLSRARNRIIKEMQARHATQRKEVRERVQAEVQQEPLYRAMSFLRRGQVVAPDGTVTKAEGVHKIDRVLAAEFAPKVDMAALGGRYGVLQDDGLHPDVVGEMFDYPTGGTLLEALAAAKPMREAVEDRTDAEMLRLYGEMNTPEAREQEIQKALHNEARARLVGVELRFMGKVQQPVRVLLEAARQAAQQVIERRRVGELRPSEFVAAESKAAREATAAMQDNKPDAAVRAKRAQLLNNQLARAALEAKDEIDTDVRYLRRVLRDSNRQRMGADVADQIANLLDRFNIAPMTLTEARRVRTLAEFLASLEERGLVPDIAESIGMRDTRIPYKNVTIGEFRDLVNAVKQLEYVGKNERKILLAKEKAEFEVVRDEIVQSVVENAGDRKANARTATTNIGRAVTAMKGFAAAHLKAASIVRILDGGKDGGPLWNYLIRSANEAGDTETSMRAEATADLTKILEPVFRAGKLGGKGVFFPSLNRNLNREGRLVVALNMGNASNMQRLLDGEGWSMEAVMPVLQSLTEDELNTVQQIWDYFEKYRPMIGQKERRLYGREPSWVEPQPLVVRSADGKTVTLRGGYYPIKYDARASLRAETMSEADEAKRDLAGAYTTATTRRSFVKSRVDKVEGRPLLYTLAGMYGGINDVIHDLTWHEWLIQANRLMRSSSFDDAVRNRYGPEYVAQVKGWIKDVAAGERGVQNEAEMALNFLRQGISSAGLGFNIVSAAMQITGFNQSIVRVGAQWIGRGIAYVAQNPMAAMREVNEKSAFMRNRSRTQFRELNEIRNMVQGQSVAMRRVQMGTYFLMMRMQRMVDVPTWHGAYEKATYEGRDEDSAIALADQAVIDSQGGGMVKDLSRVERGGPAVKLFTVFYGYMNTVYNMAAVQTMTNKNKGKLAADYAMLFVVPVVLTYMLKQALIPRTGDDEEWDMEKIARALAAEQLSYLMGTMVVAREFGEVGKMLFGVEGPRMGYGGPAGLRAIGETYQFATQLSQGEFDRGFRKSAVNMIGAFTGLPSAQINRTIDGLEALYEGETENVLAPLTGAKKR